MAGLSRLLTEKDAAGYLGLTPFAMYSDADEDEEDEENGEAVVFCCC